MADVIAVSDAMRAAVRGAHRSAVRVALIDRDGVAVEVGAVDGTVTLDRTAAVRGRCDVTLAADTVTLPTSAADTLTPYGSRLRIDRGVYLPSGDVEWCPMGVYLISQVDVEYTGAALTIRVAAMDYAQRLIDARIESAYQITGGTETGAAVLALLQDGWPTVPYAASEFAAARTTLPASVLREGDDRWQAAGSIAQAAGLTLWFDSLGVARLTVAQSPVATVADTIDDGAAGVLTGVRASWTRDGVTNRVVASGQSVAADAPPARGVATDDDPSSLTYYHGPFGRAPRFYSSPFLATDEQAQQAAASMLSAQAGITRPLALSTVCMPWLEPGDVVRVRCSRLRLDELQTIDQVTVPLAGATMSMTTRARA